MLSKVEQHLKNIVIVYEFLHIIRLALTHSNKLSNLFS